MVNEETGKAEKVKFDWVPPNTERNLAARYMALLPPEKRPVAGSEVRLTNEYRVILISTCVNILGT